MIKKQKNVHQQIVKKKLARSLYQIDPLVNRSRRSKYKAAIKKINYLIEKKDKKEALKFLPKLNSQLMRVAKTGIIKKKNASRNISRITKKINSL